MITLSSLNDDRLNSLCAEVDKEDIHKLGFSDYTLSDAQRRFINAIVARHGGGVLFRSKDKENIELQVAAPHLLETDGDKELKSRHLFINVDKVVNDGHNLAARCVKDGRIYDVRELLSMLPIEQRSLNIKPSQVKRRVSVVDKLRYMERDEQGNLIPPRPGTVIPLTELDPSHPAVESMTARGFTPQQLVDQFRAGFCTVENPKVFYKPLPGGFKSTPQGRIVFFIDQLGVERGWQARRIERWQGNDLQFLHPYTFQWVSVGYKTPQGVVLYPAYSGTTIGKAPSIILKQKYIIGLGVEKSLCLMGFDAALAWSVQTGVKTIGLVEGVLDAARLGPPFVSMMGLSLSTNQGALLSNHFERVLYTPDNDVNKDNASTFCAAVERVLTPKGLTLVKALPPSRAEDAGDMTVEEVLNFRKTYQIWV